MNLSIVICTHNPREDFLQRTLEALNAQTLPKEQWELLLIDNASEKALDGRWDLGWHPQARIIREDELGLTPARLRGIKESKGELLVFVDDDNVLDKQYLATALQIVKMHPFVGAFNGGTIGEFEGSVPDHLKTYAYELGGELLDQDYWSNLHSRSKATPFGSGLCVLRSVADRFFQLSQNESVRRMLGRNGQNLLSGEDIDLAWCAVDLGMGTGRFKDLKLVHLIPSHRLTEDYIVRLHAGYAASSEVLAELRPSFYKTRNETWKDRVRFIFTLLRSDPFHRRMILASRQARRDARRRLREAKI